MISLKLTRIGNSLGVALPKAVLERLRAAKGDSLFLVEVPDGYMLIAEDSALARQMAAAETVMHEDRSVLEALKK